jgi:hypothetical protein
MAGEREAVALGAAVGAGVAGLAAYLAFRALTGRGEGYLEGRAYADGAEVNALVRISGVPGAFTTPFTVRLAEGTYGVSASYAGQTSTTFVKVVRDQTTSVTFSFRRPVGAPPPTEPPPEPPPEPPSAPPSDVGILECHAWQGGVEVSADVEVVGVGTYRTPFVIQVPAPKNYTLRASYAGQAREGLAFVEPGKTTRADFYF